MKKFKLNKGKSIVLVLILLSAFVISNSCTKSSNDNTPGVNEVFIESNAFSPATITISAGTTITWTNKDGIAHTVTSNTAGLFDSGNMNSGATYTHTFTGAGTFAYHCTYHSNMVASVVVN